MQERVLIIGANGLLGTALMRNLSEEFSVTGTYHACPAAGLIPLDIVDAKEVERVITEIDPAIVLLPAAATDVDRCERDHAFAEAVNVRGAANVVACCARRKLVYYSTDSVFSGERGDYRETDQLGPVNYYSETKVRAEEIVRHVPQHLILRTAMLYGSRRDSPRFINWLIRNLAAGRAVPVATDLSANPTLIDDLTHATRELLRKNRIGTYHVAGATPLDCYTMAHTVATVFGFDPTLIVPKTAAELGRAAKRPKNPTLNIGKLEAEGIRMSTFAAGLQRVRDTLAADGFFQGYRRIHACRICGSGDLMPYLDLGNIPLVNRYVPIAAADVADPRFPLQILYCRNCALSQLSIVVEPDVLYREYFYRSSISKTFQQHCARFALESRRRIGGSALVVDIASNDGCTLREFQREGFRVVGVEPAANLAAIAESTGIPTVVEFWSPAIAARIRAAHGPAHLITAMNVFAHVHDLDAFLRGVTTLLQADGVLAVEVPYMLNFVNKTEFDTSYHEHLSYFLLKPLIPLFQRHGMEICDVRKFTIHGGSIRVYAKKTSSAGTPVDHDAIKWLLELESDLGLHNAETYRRFSRDVEKIRKELLELLQRLRGAGKTIAAYGASAKGNVLTNYCGIGKDLIPYIIDDTPEKQGFLTPGNHIPIVPSRYLQERKPDYLLLLAWNFAEELMEKTAEYQRNGGRYIIPIPNVRVV